MLPYIAGCSAVDIDLLLWVGDEKVVEKSFFFDDLFFLDG